jgi:hypothetical protein
MIDGMGSKPFSARTLLPIQTPEISYKNDVIEASRATYAHTKNEVETQTREWFEEVSTPPERPLKEKKEDHVLVKPQKDLSQNPYFKKAQQHVSAQPFEQSSQEFSTDQIQNKKILSEKKKETSTSIPPRRSHKIPNDDDFSHTQTSLKDALLSALAQKEQSSKNLKEEEYKTETVPQINEVAPDADSFKIQPSQQSAQIQTRKEVPKPSYGAHKKPLPKTLQKETREEKQPFKKEERAATDKSKRTLREMLEKLNNKKEERSISQTQTNTLNNQQQESQEVDPSVVKKIFE